MDEVPEVPDEDSAKMNRMSIREKMEPYKAHNSKKLPKILSYSRRPNTSPIELFSFHRKKRFEHLWSVFRSGVKALRDTRE